MKLIYRYTGIIRKKQVIKLLILIYEHENALIETTLMILAECFKAIKQHQLPRCLTAVELPDCYLHIESLSRNERNGRGLSYNTRHRAPRPGK